MSFYMGRHVEREILSALVDGELRPDERRLVHEHLQECADCRDIADELGHVQGLVGELPRLVAPVSFVSDVMQPARRPRARALPSRAFSGRRRWIAAGVAAAAVATTLAGLVVPPEASEPPVDAYIERHVSVYPGVESGAGVLFAVPDR